MTIKARTIVDETPAGRGRVWLALLPVAGFAGLAALFYAALYAGDPGTIPSVLIGKPAPQIKLDALPKLIRQGRAVPGFSTADFAGDTPVLVNIWASWCGPCRQEHPYLMQLARSGKVRIFGINYKDAPANARRFLGVLGNPYHAVGVDRAGRSSIDWGVTAVPETFLIDRAGRIVLKIIGPLSKKSVTTVLMPYLDRLGRAGETPAANFNKNKTTP